MASNEVQCRRCHCSQWKLFTTTAVEFDTAKGTHEASAYLRTEYRCSNCNTKAVTDQLPALESIAKGTEPVATPAAV